MVVTFFWKEKAESKLLSKSCEEIEPNFYIGFDIDIFLV